MISHAFKILFLVSWFLFFTFYINAQPTLEWDRFYPQGNEFKAGAHAMALDDSGNVYVSGYAYNDNNPLLPYFNAFCTIKYSSSGLQQWAVQYRGTNLGGRYAYAIALDKYNSVYVAGYSYEGSNYFDFCTVKYNSNGVQQWVRTYNGPISGIDQAQQITVDIAGNIYVSGFSVNSGNATVKYSPDGNELWVKTFPYWGDVNGLLTDENCNVYIAFDLVGAAATIKYDSAGNELWTRFYEGYGPRIGAKSIALDKYNDVYITGYSWRPQIESEYFTIKYSSSGIQQWLRRFSIDSTQNSQSKANAIAIDDACNIYVSGFTELNASIPKYLTTLKYTINGDLLWIQTNKESLNSIKTYMTIDKNSNVYAVGQVSLPSPIYWGMGVIKYDSFGTEKWMTVYESVIPNGINIDNFFNVFLSGKSVSRMCTIKYTQPVGVINTGAEIPKYFKLYQNYPNPFNPVTKIKFNLPVPQAGLPPSEGLRVRLIIYDILGREIKTLVNEELKPGTYEIDFDGSNYPSGVYFYCLNAYSFIDSKKMILLR